MGVVVAAIAGMILIRNRYACIGYATKSKCKQDQLELENKWTVFGCIYACVCMYGHVYNLHRYKLDALNH